MQDDGKQETATLSAREVIERFGGIRPAAKAIGVAFTTVQGWKERDHIPEHRWTELRAAAAEQGIDLSEVTGSPALKEAKTEEVVTVSMDEPSVAPAADSAGKEKQAEPASGAAGSDGKVENADAPAEEKSDSSPWSEQTSPKPDDAAEAEQETSEPDDTEKKPRYVFWTLFVLALMLGTAIATWPRWNHLAKPYIESYVPPLAGILYRTKDPAPVTPAPTPAPAAEAPADPAAVAPESAKAPASQSNQPAVSD
ncbi:MAG: hypothetical protein RLN80_03590, partial [Rhodospirillales bacterium]